VDVITANPKTAGVARWNFLALWGHRLDKGEAAALDYVTKARATRANGSLQCMPVALSGQSHAAAP
jgi:ABC-type sulfate transport system substrate-binding protein